MYFRLIDHSMHQKGFLQVCSYQKPLENLLDIENFSQKGVLLNFNFWNSNHGLSLSNRANHVDSQVLTLALT